MNYYNEIEPFAAQWMRNLINAGHIAPGIVDERSIEDVRPDDLRGFTQCHFFAGIGVWSYALRLAGWPDDRPVWTGSCPCQPFSQAGEGSGFADERHLWPHFHWLIQERRPPAVLGEQVASKDAGPWLDLVHADLEGLGYAFGAVPFPSASVGAPHIRDRLFWVAHANSGTGRKGRADIRGRTDRGDAQPRAGSGSGCVLDGLAHHNSCGWSAQPGPGVHDTERHAEPCRCVGWLGHADGEHAGRHPGAGNRPQAGSGLRQGGDVPGAPSEDGRAGATNGFWRDADWLLCRDGKWRPVEPGTFPLAHGAASRVGRLRAYGNAINAEAARVFIETVMGCAP